MRYVSTMAKICVYEVLEISHRLDISPLFNMKCKNICSSISMCFLQKNHNMMEATSNVDDRKSSNNCFKIKTLFSVKLIYKCIIMKEKKIHR